MKKPVNAGLVTAEAAEGPAKAEPALRQSRIISVGRHSNLVYMNRTSRVMKNEEQREATQDLSCVPQANRTRGATNRAAASRRRLSTVGGENLAERERNKHALAAHLRSIAPFNKRWKVTQTINEGTFGVVFAVQDIETHCKGVIKVAKSDGNAPAQWEAFILEKMQKMNELASVVRILDKGMLADHNGFGMEFMVLEKAAIPILDYIGRYSGNERRIHVSYIMLDMLKGIHDMHCQGLLHRDLKPDNMGIMSEQDPVAVLFDLGMVRMYTGYFGESRLPRTSVCFRGTPEWASGHANKGREQTRLDDVIGWMYVAVELYDDTASPMQPLPWTTRNNHRAIRYFKSIFAPARIVFKRCPPQFYGMNAYLMTADRYEPPDYDFLADTMVEIIEMYQKKLGSPEKYNRFTRVGKNRDEDEDNYRDAPSKRSKEIPDILQEPTENKEKEKSKKAKDKKKGKEKDKSHKRRRAKGKKETTETYESSVDNTTNATVDDKESKDTVEKKDEPPPPKEREDSCTRLLRQIEEAKAAEKK